MLSSCHSQQGQGPRGLREEVCEEGPRVWLVLAGSWTPEVMMPASLLQAIILGFLKQVGSPLGTKENRRRIFK